METPEAGWVVTFCDGTILCEGRARSAGEPVKWELGLRLHSLAESTQRACALPQAWLPPLPTLPEISRYLGTRCSDVIS